MSIIREELQEIFRTVFIDDALVLGDGMTREDFPTWDFLAHINLMFAIEQEFGFAFRGNELAEFATIGELIAHVERATPSLALRA